MLARLAWRFAKARAVARGARRLLIAQGSPVARHSPRVRLQLSPRLWLGSFLVTSLIYLVQIDAEGISVGRWPLLAPWLHTESYARETVARASRLSAETLSVPRTSLDELIAPRSLFGLAFEVRPPPAPA